jgi:hypothetical protein
MNKLTGECPVELAGQTYTLRFTWAAVAEVQAAYGDDPNLDELPTLAAVGAAGLRMHHPEMTAERLTELSPAIFPFRLALERAWEWAWCGPEGAAGIAAKGPKAADPPGQGSRRPMRRPWRRASTPSSSGG